MYPDPLGVKKWGYDPPAPMGAPPLLGGALLKAKAQNTNIPHKQVFLSSHGVTTRQWLAHSSRHTNVTWQLWILKNWARARG